MAGKGGSWISGVFKAIAVGMSAGSVVLLILGEASTHTILLLMGIGLFAVSVGTLDH